MGQNRLLKWIAIFGCWTVIGLIFASQAYVSNNAWGYPVTWVQALTWSFTEWYTWAALSPFILWLANRFYIDPQSWRRNALIHLGASILFSGASILIQAMVEQWTTWAHTKPTTFSGSLFYYATKKWHMGILVYWMIVGISHAFGYYRRYRERELRATQLESQLTRAQLQALKMQLHPHFLFNTLHTISEMIHRDPKAADRMVVRLGDLLRQTLESNGVEEVTLKQELEFLEKYLEIERARFHDRLTVRINVEPDCLDARVPNLFLQPLVENAIRHGISARPGAGRIEIQSRRENGSLHISVRDNGCGLPENWRAEGSRTGVGLANTQARLMQLYGTEHSFELHNCQSGGLEIVLKIPCRDDPLEAGPQAKGGWDGEVARVDR